MFTSDLAGRLANGVLRELWQNYRKNVTDVPRIEDALRSLGEVWHEDHVAFRTLPGAHCGAHVLEGLFILLGYRRRDSYEFPDKCLTAFWMEPPADPNTPARLVLPKVFISELQIEKFTREFQNCVEKYALQPTASPLGEWQTLFEKLKRAPSSEDFNNLDLEAFENLKASMISYLAHGPSWQRPSIRDYQLLLHNSEYAAWTLIFGSVPNHFTVSVHLMKRFSTLTDFHNFLRDKLSVAMNQAGGSIIKGSQSVQLEQCATLACHVPVLFQEGIRILPYAFVEFAFRHPHTDCAADGLWASYYQGFVTDNADKIFESTNVLAKPL